MGTWIPQSPMVRNALYVAAMRVLVLLGKTNTQTNEQTPQTSYFHFITGPANHVAHYSMGMSLTLAKKMLANLIQTQV